MLSSPPNLRPFRSPPTSPAQYLATECRFPCKAAVVAALTSCDSQRVSIGRGQIAVAALALALGLVGSAAAQPTAQSAAKKKVKVVFFKAHVRSDGFVSPGQPETVTVLGMPP